MGNAADAKAREATALRLSQAQDTASRAYDLLREIELDSTQPLRAQSLAGVALAKVDDLRHMLSATLKRVRAEPT